MKFTPEAIQSLIRLILTAVGSYLIGHYFLGTQVTGEWWEGVIGFILAIVSIIWSIRSNTVTIEMWQSLVRQAITIVGGIFIAKGWINETTVESIGGILLLLFPYLQARTDETKVKKIHNGEINIRQLKAVKGPKKAA